MKRFLFFSALLSMLMMTVFASCKKEEDEPFNIPVEIFNLRQETVNLYVDGSFKYEIEPDMDWKWSYKSVDGDPVHFEIKTMGGRVLSSETVRRGESYFVVLNRESADSETSNTMDQWTFNLEVTNLSSSFVHVYIDGVKSKVIETGIVSTFTHTVVNQNSSKVEVKTSTGVVLDSKTVSRGGYYSNKVKDSPAKLGIYNDKSDSYMIYIDDVYITTLAPGEGYSYSFDLGTHELYAKQKDGYLLWATEIEITYNFTKSFATTDVSYEWRLSSKQIESGVG